MQITLERMSYVSISHLPNAPKNPVGLDSEKRTFSEKMRKERKKRGKEAKNRAKMQNLCRMGI